MNKLLVIILALAFAVMVFTLGGCGGNDEPVPAPAPTGADAGQAAGDPGGDQDNPPIIEDDFPPDGEPEPVPTEAPEEEPPAVPADCSLKFKGAPERSDGDYAKVYEINCGGEYLENSYVWCDAEMKDFECVSVEMNDDGSFTRTGVYSHIDSVKPGEAVYIIVELPEVIPNAAFVYTAEGEQYVWLIGYNGRDGGMSLSPLEADQLADGE